MKLYWPVRIEDGAYINVGNLFGANPDTYDQFDLKGHNGLDFIVQNNKPIYASHDGLVEYFEDKDAQGKYIGFGRYAVITALEGYKTYYAHQLAFIGARRQVNAGELIGKVDSTGFSTGPHLHFGFKPVNPNYNNGYKGAEDPSKYLADEKDKPSMTKYFKVNDHGKLGVMILEGFTGVIIFEDNFPEYLTQLTILNKITDQTPTINIP